VAPKRLRDEPQEKDAYEATAEAAGLGKEERIALATLLRHHMLVTHETSTDLSRKFGLPVYIGARKKETAHELNQFMQKANPVHSIKIRDGFAKLLNDEYRKDTPVYIKHAIHVVYDRGPNRSQITSSPHNVISGIRDPTPGAGRAVSELLSGVWNVVRYAHHGERVVRAAMVIEEANDENGHDLPTFTIHFRTFVMTGTPAKLVVTGSIIPLRRGEHLMFLGQEGTDYPLTIMVPKVLDKNTPFIGLVQRRHHERGAVFAIKAYFCRADVSSIDELSPRIGSWVEEEALKEILADIPNIPRILRSLQISPPNIRAGLIL